MTTPEPPPATSGRRLSLITVDQILSSVAGVGVIIWVAHTFPPADFGRFSLIVMVYMVAQVGVRSLISTAVVVHPEEADGRPRTILASALLVGVLAGLLCALVGLALLLAGSDFGPPVLALAAPMPLLLTHDVGRYLGIARQQPIRAVALDCWWIALLATGLVAVLLTGADSLVWVVLAWAGSGAVAGLWVFVQYGAPSAEGIAWVREHWGFSWRALVSGVTSSGITVVSAGLMALVSSPLAVAAFRAATLLAAPSTAVQMAVSTNAAADIAREREVGGAFWRHVRRAIAVCTVVGVLNLLVLVFLPDVLGRLVLGEAWELVKPLMLPISLKVLLMAGQSGLRAALIGRHRIQAAMVTDIVSIFLIGICMVLGAAWGDVEGALWAMAVGTAVSTGCWWIAIAWKGRDTPVLRR